MKAKGKFILAIYFAMILFGWAPYLLDTIGNVSSYPLWLENLRFGLMAPTLPLVFIAMPLAMMLDSSNPDPRFFLTILAPLYLAILFWPMPLIACRPAKLDPRLRRTIIIYSIILLCWLCFCALVVTEIMMQPPER